jgi:hypothetical protein
VTNFLQSFDIAQMSYSPSGPLHKVKPSKKTDLDKTSTSSSKVACKTDTKPSNGASLKRPLSANSVKTTNSQTKSTLSHKPDATASAAPKTNGNYGDYNGNKKFPWKFVEASDEDT